MRNQQKIWNNIAPEWYEFKTSPSRTATELINNSKGKILDFGSGSGRNLLGVKKSEQRELYLVDFSEKMLKLAEKRAKELGLKIHTKLSRLEKIEFPDNFFDVAICTAAIHSIETAEKREKALKELFRILKPKAKANIQVWDRNSERFKGRAKEKFVAWRDKGKRYYYLYEENELKKLLEKTGFNIIEKIPHKANIIFIVEKPISS